MSVCRECVDLAAAESSDPTPTSRERPAPLTKSGIALRRELPKSGTLIFGSCRFSFQRTLMVYPVSSQPIATHSPDISAGPAVGRELRDPNYFPARQLICCCGSSFWNSTDWGDWLLIWMCGARAGAEWNQLLSRGTHVVLRPIASRKFLPTGGNLLFEFYFGPAKSPRIILFLKFFFSNDLFINCADCQVARLGHFAVCPPTRPPLFFFFKFPFRNVFPFIFLWLI